ncbi:MAG: hypothetical protein ACPH5P_02675 [Akkermansiaceae bacterium]
MTKRKTGAEEITIKIAIIGQPLSGKKNIIRQVAAQYGQSALKSQMVSGADIVRAEFIWPEPVSGGPFIRVRIFALIGEPFHQAAEQLLLSGCDALVFVVNCNPSKISESRSALVNLMANADLAGLDWGATTMVLQYNNAETYANINPEELDAWLGVNTDQVQRYLSHSNKKEELGVAVDAAIRGVISGLSEQAASDALT